ncbi:uncharacterized protein BXZ73DRAFT_107842 [Epithele typhae]|uniref:uncharacterized protein n=1 Tax=Epithele typhae TaxID=378194 RepID=UPI002007DC43|nr:uncharacterized protein BXZ73DRAFT_107842 [Epithele typhae]KAH9911723.1 hypothetical protein BXZ73DRAFT_107842 [Epithele typhae]
MDSPRIQSDTEGFNDSDCNDADSLLSDFDFPAQNPVPEQMSQPREVSNTSPPQDEAPLAFYSISSKSALKTPPKMANTMLDDHCDRADEDLLNPRGSTSENGSPISTDQGDAISGSPGPKVEDGINLGTPNIKRVQTVHQHPLEKDIGTSDIISPQEKSPFQKSKSKKKSKKQGAVKVEPIAKQVQTHALRLFGRKTARSPFRRSKLATLAEADAFDEKAGKPCCTPDTFKVSFDAPPGHSFNKSAIRVFAQSFLQSHERSAQDEDLIVEKFYRHFRTLRDNLPKYGIEEDVDTQAHGEDTKEVEAGEHDKHTEGVSKVCTRAQAGSKSKRG